MPFALLNVLTLKGNAMKKLLFLIPMLIQSAFALTDSGTETNPYLISAHEYYNAPYIYYSESGIHHGITLEDAFGVPFLSKENSVEVNRIIYEVKDDIIKPASISGQTVLMKYRNFKNQELIDFYNSTLADNTKRVHDEVEAQKQRNLQIANAILNNQKFQNHLKCSSSFNLDNTILDTNRAFLDEFKSCLNYIHFDISEFQKLLNENVSEAETFQRINYILREVNIRYYNTTLSEVMEQVYNHLKNEDKLKKSCPSPRSCFVPASTKERLIALFQDFYHQGLPGKWGVDLTLELDNEEFKSLKVTKEELKKFEIWDSAKNSPGSLDYHDDSVDEVKILTSTKIYYLRIFHMRDEQVEAMLESAKSAAIKKTQDKINTWLKSLKGNDVAEITDTKINAVGMEQYIEERNNSEKINRNISKEDNSSNADQL